METSRRKCFCYAYAILFFLAIYYIMQFLLTHAYMSSTVTLSIDNYIEPCSFFKKLCLEVDYIATRYVHLV